MLVHNSLLIKDQNVWMSMISPLKRFLAAVAADLGHTTSEVIFGENNTEKEIFFIYGLMDTGSPTL